MLTEKELDEIRRRMLELEEEPPADGWKNIRTQLGPRRRWRFLWWTIPLALLITTVGLLLVQVGGGEKTRAVRSTGNAAQSQVTKTDSGTRTPSADLTAPDAANSESTTARGSAPAEKTGTGKEIGDSRKDNTLEPGATAAPDRQLSPSGPVSGPSAPGLKTPADASQTRAANLPLPGHKNQPEHGNRSRRKRSSLAGRERPEETSISRNEERQSADGPLVVLPAEKGKKNSVTGESDKGIATGEFSRSPIPAILRLDSRRILTQGQSPGLMQLPDSIRTVKDSSAELEEDEKIRITEPQKAREWMVGVFGGPRYSFRSFTPVGSDEIYISRLNNQNRSNTQRMGYELGLSLSRSITSTLYLRTSLAFTRLNENLSYSYTGKIDTVLRSLTDEGEILVNVVRQTGERQLISSYAYAGWRAGATWYFWQNGHRRYNLSLDGGVNLLVKGQTKEFAGEKWLETVYFPSPDNLLEQTNYNLQAGFGYNFMVRRRYELSVMPTLNYFLGSTFRSREPFGLRPYSLGIHVQLSRRMGRKG
jgi:hypothetical protein